MARGRLFPTHRCLSAPARWAPGNFSGCCGCPRSGPIEFGRNAHHSLRRSYGTTPMVATRTVALLFLLTRCVSPFPLDLAATRLLRSLALGSIHVRSTEKPVFQ